MNTRQLIDKLLEKWPQKIICLMLAIFLYVFHQVSLIEKKVFVLPLTVIENGNVMQIGDCPSNVSVVVRANNDVINSIHVQDLKASINLNNIAHAGTVKVPVTIELNENLLVYDPLEVKVKPEYITLEVDKKVAKYVPVVPSISGEVAEGYMITKIDINPSSVSIFGPEILVNSINEVQTDALVVSNAETNFADDIYYLEVNKLISVENKGPYKATVVVEPKPMEKDYEDIHIVTRNLLPSLMIENEIPDIDFTLSGTVPILGKYILGVNTVSLDFSEITEPGVYDIPVKFLLPVNIILKSKSFESVNITVVENKEALEPIEEPVVTE